MRLPYIILAVVVFINILVDTYIYFALNSYCRRRIHSKMHLILSVILLCLSVAIFCLPVRRTGDEYLVAVMWMLFGYLSVYIVKYFFVISDVLSRIPCIFKYNRWKWLSWTGLTAGIVFFGGMWWGALFNRMNIQIKEAQVVSPDIPAAFNGFRIAQISDLHVGTYGRDTAFLGKLVREINTLKPDMIVFTGDIVNRYSAELSPFVHVLSGLHAPYGVYSVMGNHDYGDYRNWSSDAEKEADVTRLKKMQSDMGWEMLNNDYKAITLHGDTLMLIGVENVGDPPFRTYGSLTEAYPSLGDRHFKILLSHNPAHWDNDICNHRDKNIALTLAGHTHAMQMEIFGLSPASMRYKHWGAMYTDSIGRDLYVNIGTGTVGFPARIGATPEITILTLRRGIRAK